jgi:hypothetical protein
MPSLGGWPPDVPCASCGTRVAGLAWGERCPACRAGRLARANRIARRISLAATLLVGLYVLWRTPPFPLARVYGAIAVLATYLIVRRIAQRLALELLPDRSTPTSARREE